MHNKAPLKSAQLLLPFRAGVVVVVVAGVIVVVAVAAVAVAAAADAAAAVAAAPLAICCFWKLCNLHAKLSTFSHKPSAKWPAHGARANPAAAAGTGSRGKDKRRRCDRQTLHGVQVPARL